MANLLTTPPARYPSEAKTQPPVSVESESPFQSMVGDLVERMAAEVVRYYLALPVIRSDALKSRHLQYLGWLNGCILNDMQALKTLAKADTQVGNPSPDAMRFLNATIEAAERDLTALSILSDWLTTLESR